MKFGLIGYPIAHSLSPSLWAEFFPDSEHTYQLMEESDFEKAYALFMAEYQAVNVTMPFKELAYYKSIPADENVRAIKAVNILKKTESGVVGYNSDFLAVRSLIAAALPTSAGASVMIVGAGGAARAAAIAAVSLGCKVAMANRSHENALSFVRHTSFRSHPLDVAVPELQNAVPYAAEADVIVYAVPKPLEQISTWNFAGKTVIEANYLDPCLRERTLMEGGVYVSGREWLRLQAESGYKLFF